MRHKRLVILAAAAVAAALALWAAARPGQEKEKTMQPAEMPVVRAAVGRKITEVQADSRMDFDLRSKNDNSPHVIEQPVVVEYADERLGLRLPPTRFVWIAQQAGVVTEIETSPHLEFLSLEEAHALATRLAEQFAASRWNTLGRQPVSLERMRAAVADPERYWTFEQPYGEWASGSLRLELTLRESGKGVPKELKTEPLFVVNARFHDRALREKMEGVVFRAREDVNKDINQPLPLSYHLPQ
ncbi:MAG TPA: hypothetical protein VGV38_12805 [Pyrinomonadaceae bacterium]|nr:hypothetical protein [Pyrinomonadaceae bacterium]